MVTSWKARRSRRHRREAGWMHAMWWRGIEAGIVETRRQFTLHTPVSFVWIGGTAYPFISCGQFLETGSSRRAQGDLWVNLAFVKHLLGGCDIVECDIGVLDYEVVCSGWVNLWLMVRRLLLVLVLLTTVAAYLILVVKLVAIDRVLFTDVIDLGLETDLQAAKTCQILHANVWYLITRMAYWCSTLTLLQWVFEHDLKSTDWNLRESWE